MDEPSSETKAILFNDLIPLPFRISGLIQLGLTFWFLLNVILFNFSSLNILQLLNLSYNPHKYAQLDGPLPASGEYATTMPADRNENSRFINGIWSSLKGVSLINVISWAIFKAVQYFNGNWKVIYYSIPIIQFAYIFNRIFYENVSSPGQVRIWTTMQRIIQGKINFQTMRSNDILISDSMVSFAKVINDFGLFIWGFYIDESTAYNYKLEFIILCIPTLIRIRQCWFEYRTTRQLQHLLNLVKYSTGIGPLIVNVFIKSTLVNATEQERQSGDLFTALASLNRWWYVFSALNSTYSFIWDIKMDWHLQLFNKFFNPKAQFSILRIHKAYPDYIYFAAIVIDFFLRFIWVLKIFIINDQLSQSDIKLIHVFSTFLFGYDAYSFGYVVIETLEIFRRWMWCFIKLESDWVKLKLHESEQEEGPNDIDVDVDVELAEMGKR
ncbi:ERD1 [Candida margitis]|uniref:ERD1 n=1 Tax=Candida margitis TaxID=1775924 RepID=UPI002225D2BA|nr:ERD1 [Candida margitis]KAI5969923.1 ERD1 [Candida margitis]